MSGHACGISIEGIEVFAHHGVLPEEKERGQRFRIDIRLELAGVPGSDEIGSTVDYSRLAADASRLAVETRFDLIETLAELIVEMILEDRRVLGASVTVSKPDAPMPVAFENVSVTVSASRRDPEKDPHTGEGGS